MTVAEYLYIVSTSKYGDTSTFSSLAEAEAAIRDCGYRPNLEERGLEIWDADGELVGEIVEVLPVLRSPIPPGRFGRPASPSERRDLLAQWRPDFRPGRMLFVRPSELGRETALVYIEKTGVGFLAQAVRVTMKERRA